MTTADAHKRSGMAPAVSVEGRAQRWLSLSSSSLPYGGKVAGSFGSDFAGRPTHGVNSLFGGHPSLLQAGCRMFLAPLAPIAPFALDPSASKQEGGP